MTTNLTERQQERLSEFLERLSPEVEERLFDILNTMSDEDIAIIQEMVLAWQAHEISKKKLIARLKIVGAWGGLVIMVLALWDHIVAIGRLLGLSK